MEFIFVILDYLKFNVENNYYLTIFCFFIFLLIYNTFAIPGNILFISASGFFFGIYIGYLISIISLVFGSLIFISVGSLLLDKIIPKFINKYSYKINKYIKDSSLEYLIIFRMIPGPPLFLQNLILSSLNINKLKICISTSIGFSPFVFITVFFGEALNNIEKIKNISFSDIFSLKFLFFLFFLIFLMIVKIFYKKN